MSTLKLTLLVLAAAVPLAIAVPTATGARRRGNGAFLSGVAGLAFPITWVAWYLRDEHPYRH